MHRAIKSMIILSSARQKTSSSFNLLFSSYPSVFEVLSPLRNELAQLYGTCSKLIGGSKGIDSILTGTRTLRNAHSTITTRSYCKSVHISTYACTQKRVYICRINIRIREG